MIRIMILLIIIIGTCNISEVETPKNVMNNSPVSQYECPCVVALASSACVDKTTKIITEFTCKDPFYI